MFDAVTYVLAKNASKKYTDYVATTLEWKTEIVDTVPDPAEADNHTIYFVPIDPEDTSKGYDEYIKVNDSLMEKMGSTDIDLNSLGFSMDDEDDELLIFDSGATPPEEDPEVYFRVFTGFSIQRFLRNVN